MVAFIPFKHLEFDSAYSAPEIIALIEKSVAPIKWWPVIPSPKPFLGRTKKDGFYIHRAISYRNSWQPVAYGVLTNVNGKVRVRINISWAYSVLIMTPFFIVFWLFFMMFVFFPILKLNPVLPLLGLVLLYVLAMIHYTSEASKLEGFLLPLLSSI